MGVDITMQARDQTPELTDEEIIETRRADIRSGNRFGRELEPVDVAKMVAFLVSDDAAYITGQSIRVDGGLARPL